AGPERIRGRGRAAGPAAQHPGGGDPPAAQPPARDGPGRTARHRGRRGRDGAGDGRVARGAGRAGAGPRAGIAACADPAHARTQEVVLANPIAAPAEDIPFAATRWTLVARAADADP